MHDVVGPGLVCDENRGGIENVPDIVDIVKNQLERLVFRLFNISLMPIRHFVDLSGPNSIDVFELVDPER